MVKKLPFSYTILNSSFRFDAILIMFCICSTIVSTTEISSPTGYDKIIGGFTFEESL